MGFERVLTPLGHLILVFANALPSSMPIVRVRAEPLNVILACPVSLVVIRIRRARVLRGSDATTGHHRHEEDQGEPLDLRAFSGHESSLYLRWFTF
jgi:hypothetical protein